MTCRVDTLKPGWNGLHFANNSLKCIFLNENYHTLLKISLKFPRIQFIVIIDLGNELVLPGNKPLPELMMTIIIDAIYHFRPQWVKPYHVGPDFSRQTRSISWLLMPWLLVDSKVHGGSPCLTQIEPCVQQSNSINPSCGICTRKSVVNSNFH